MVNIAKLRSKLEEALPPIIARSQIEFYLGGLYKAGTMTTYDSQGKGIKNPIRLQDGKVGYYKENLIDWFISKVETTNDIPNENS